MPDVKLVSPYKCRLWAMHDRLGEELTVESCTPLLESLKRHGQKQPALGRRISDPECEVELIYGARRLFAAQHLGIQLLVELRDIDDRAALVEMDIENRVRMDISPYERGLSYKRWLRERYFANQVEIAKSLGISEAQVSRLLRYAELPSAVVAGFKTPSVIREEWAVVLAKQCKDPVSRTEVIRRARDCAGRQNLSAQEIYDTIVGRRANRIVPTRSRDEVVRDRLGTPLIRIGFRAKTVHLIIPREKITRDLLAQISVGVRRVLEASAGEDARNQLDNAL